MQTISSRFLIGFIALTLGASSATAIAQDPIQEVSYWTQDQEIAFRWYFSQVQDQIENGQYQLPNWTPKQTIEIIGGVGASYGVVTTARSLIAGAGGDEGAESLAARLLIGGSITAIGIGVSAAAMVFIPSPAQGETMTDYYIQHPAELIKDNPKFPKVSPFVLAQARAVAKNLEKNPLKFYALPPDVAMAYAKVDPALGPMVKTDLKKLLVAYVSSPAVSNQNNASGNHIAPASSPASTPLVAPAL